MITQLVYMNCSIIYSLHGNTFLIWQHISIYSGTSLSENFQYLNNLLDQLEHFSNKHQVSTIYFRATYIQRFGVGGSTIPYMVTITIAIYVIIDLSNK